MLLVFISSIKEIADYILIRTLRIFVKYIKGLILILCREFEIFIVV